MRRAITLGEILDSVRYAENNARYRVWPGTVQQYYPPVAGQSPATVDVEVGVDDHRIDPTSGEVFFEPFPVLARVPLASVQLGGFAMWGPAKPGDHVVLIAFDTDVSIHMATGQKAKPVMLRRNSGMHWIAMPFSICDPDALPDPGGKVCFGKVGGPLIAVDDQHVNLGSASPSDAVALAPKLDLLIKTIMSWTPASGDGGAALQAALTLAGFTATTSVASSKVKCAP